MDMSQVPGSGPAGLSERVGKSPVNHDEMIDGFGIVTVVEDFIPGVDRLLLDFDAGTAMPEVSFDTELEDGSTAVMGDGLLMVVLRGVKDVQASDVEMRTLPAPIDPDDLPSLEVIDHFDPDEDEIEVLYDAPPQSGHLPQIEVRDFADQTGAVVLFDGEPILAVRGAQGLQPSDVKLIPRSVQS